ncbi:hypothetical protein [Streptomyces clavuligerus]|uniref:hypothetical protein n=1 Tax=Streptomyces clavuligerus TaxID=1901 RepID=UPI001E32AA7B|nr:hypothetical protein [Streptomyces clavuligerus]
MLLALAVITAGALVRQSDRLHFARGRPACAGPARLIALQRSRANNLTPALLLAGQWIQITGHTIAGTRGEPVTGGDRMVH